VTCNGVLHIMQTVGDLRSFIAASRPDLAGTAYRLATAFPAAELTDDAATIQSAGLANAVVVQKPA
jgi:UBX domain-containing protein 1